MEGAGLRPTQFLEAIWPAYASLRSASAGKLPWLEGGESLAGPP